MYFYLVKEIFDKIFYSFQKSQKTSFFWQFFGVFSKFCPPPEGFHRHFKVWVPRLKKINLFEFSKRCVAFWETYLRASNSLTPQLFNARSIIFFWCTVLAKNGLQNGALNLLNAHLLITNRIEFELWWFNVQDKYANFGTLLYYIYSRFKGRIYPEDSFIWQRYASTL